QAVRFNYNRDYYANYLSQTISGNALQAYIACLDRSRQTPGIVIWLDKREGDYFSLNAFWVGDRGESIGKFDQGFLLIDNGTVVAKPETWDTGKNVQIVIKKTPDVDAFLNVGVNGKRRSLVLVRDPRVVTMATAQVIGQRLSANSNNVSGTVCGAGFA